MTTYEVLRLVRTERRYYVYIMASRSLTLYTGVTDSIYRRALEHKSGKIEGFTKRYNINRLVYYETFKHIGNAIAREKQVKAWTRAKRIALIKSLNPTWQDLADGWGEKVELQIPHFVRDDKELERVQSDKELEANQGRKELEANQDDKGLEANQDDKELEGKATLAPCSRPPAL